MRTERTCGPPQERVQVHREHVAAQDTVIERKEQTRERPQEAHVQRRAAPPRDDAAGGKRCVVTRTDEVVKVEGASWRRPVPGEHRHMKVVVEVEARPNGRPERDQARGE
jgi:hypothetical protein